MNQTSLFDFGQKVQTNPQQLFEDLKNSGALDTQKRTILNILMDFEWHTTATISKYIKQYNARIYELRKEGFYIVSETNKETKEQGYRLRQN
jgi:hypothetical protein